MSVSAENDRQTIGEKVAYQNAFEELWPLLGYELSSKLAQAKAAVPEQRSLTWDDVATYDTHRDPVLDQIAYRLRFKDGLGTISGSVKASAAMDGPEGLRDRIMEDCNKQHAQLKQVA